MAKYEQELNFRNVDVETLASDDRKAYEAYKAAQREAARLRVAFESGVIHNASLPVGMTIKFGYRFGQLGMALAKADAPKASKAKTVSLAHWLKMQPA